MLLKEILEELLSSLIVFLAQVEVPDDGHGLPLQGGQQVLEVTKSLLQLLPSLSSCVSGWHIYINVISSGHSHVLEPMSRALIHLWAAPSFVLVQNDPGPVYRFSLRHFQTICEVV